MEIAYAFLENGTMEMLRCLNAHFLKCNLVPKKILNSKYFVDLMVQENHIQLLIPF